MALNSHLPDPGFSEFLPVTTPTFLVLDDSSLRG